MPVGGNYSDDSQHRHKVVMLDGGLDLVTPPLFVEPGRLVDCLNYECVDKSGYKKIEGFERYDGGPSTAITSGYYLLIDRDVHTTLALLETATGVSVGARIQLEFGLDSADPRVYATVVSVEAVTVAGGLALNDEYWKVFFSPDDPVRCETGIAAISPSNPDVIGYDEGYTTFWSVSKINSIARVAEEGALASSLVSQEDVRAGIDGLPGDVFPYGLQYYKDRVFALANCQYIYIVYDHTQSVPTTTADAQFFVGNVFRNGSDGREGIILDYKWLYGDFGALSTSGTLATSAVAKLLVRFTNKATLATNTVLSIDRVNPEYAVASVAYWKYISTLTGTSATDNEPVWGGVLYKGLEENVGSRTSDNDWEPVDMGLEVGFKDGNSTIIPRELTLSTTVAQLNNEIQTVTYDPANAAASFSQSSGMQGYINSAALFPGDPITNGQVALTGGHDLSTANTTGVYLTYSAGKWGDGTANTFKNFGFSIPEDVIVTGITVAARCFYNSSSTVNDTYFHTVQLTTTGSINKGSALQSLSATTNANSASAKTFSFGGANDKWGVGTLSPADINSADFGVTMTPMAVSSTAATSYLFWDVLTITVHYFRPVGKVFFYDNTSELEGKLVRISVTKGSWADGTAEGVMHVYGFVDNNARNYLKPGEDIRLVSGGSAIAEVTSVKGSFLPSHADVVASDRRVQMLVANYFLNPDWDTIYGCTGLGRAFSYDNTYFRKIYTAYASQLDKPRHIASYRNYLALGYESGNVLLSKVGEAGPEPENFDPLQGAREFSFVGRITGLSELADTSLGVFCSQSIDRIVLNPNASSSTNLFYTASISPNSGAIEYTVAAFGQYTLYCDQYGIRSVDQTDVYGDFIGRPLSFPISPWISQRLSGNRYWLDSRRAKRPLFAHTIRAKNQYRVWFDDGYVLSMNMNTSEDTPRFTLSRYGFNFGGAFSPLLPIAHSSLLDNEGTERTHIAHWNRLADSANADNDPDLFKYVFELERGWSFDGQDFPTRATINLSFLEEPFDYDQIRKIEIHGLDYNNTTLFAGFGTKYGEEMSYTGMSLGSTFTPAGRNVAGTLSTDYTPWSKMVNCATRGRPLYFKLKNSSTATGGESTSAIEPPHILQALLVHYNPARTEN